MIANQSAIRDDIMMKRCYIKKDRRSVLDGSSSSAVLILMIANKHAIRDNINDEQMIFQ